MHSNNFDINAAEFDQHRVLPEGVPEAIRREVWAALKTQAGARVLDLGAGTGRIGRAFVAARDPYFAVDFSLEMLQQFHSVTTEGPAPVLVQADGSQLPFASHTFAVVMLMQVLSSADDSRGLLNEVLRVLRLGGLIVTGHTVMPDDGVDHRMKQRLNELLRERGVEPPQGSLRRHEALDWLEGLAIRRTGRVAASWNTSRAPRQFLARHRTGARFSRLPAEIRDEAMDRLGEWATAAFGSLDAVFPEQHSFELEFFEL